MFILFYKLFLLFVQSRRYIRCHQKKILEDIRCVSKLFYPSFVLWLTVELYFYFIFPWSQTQWPLIGLKNGLVCEINVADSTSRVCVGAFIRMKLRCFLCFVVFLYSYWATCTTCICMFNTRPKTQMLYGVLIWTKCALIICNLSLLITN